MTKIVDILNRYEFLDCNNWKLGCQDFIGGGEAISLSLASKIAHHLLDREPAPTPTAEPSVEERVSMDEKDFMAAYAVTKFMAKLDCKIGRWLVRCLIASLDERERAEAAKGGAA